MRHVGGKLRGGLRFTRLGQNKIGVRVGFPVEVNDHRGLLIGGGVERIHIVHVIHATHLLFDGGGYGLFECLRVCANIGRLYLHFRRGDVWELGDRQTGDRNRADDDGKNGDHHRHDRSIDEEVRHLNYFPFASLEFGENGLGLTCAPGRTFCTPSATTRSPGFSPSSTTHIQPTPSPTLTFPLLTFFFPPL